MIVTGSDNAVGATLLPVEHDHNWLTGDLGQTVVLGHGAAHAHSIAHADISGARGVDEDAIRGGRITIPSRVLDVEAVQVTVVRYAVVLKVADHDAFRGHLGAIQRDWSGRYPGWYRWA